MSNTAFEISQNVHQDMQKMMDEYVDQMIRTGIKEMTDGIKEVLKQYPWLGYAKATAKIYQDYEQSLQGDLQNKISGFFSGDQSFVQFAKGINNYDEVLAQAKKFQDGLMEKLLQTVPKMTNYGSQLITEIERQENARYEKQMIDKIKECIQKYAKIIQDVTTDTEKKINALAQDNNYYVPFRKIVHETGVIYFNSLKMIYKDMQKLDLKKQELIQKTIQKVI